MKHNQENYNENQKPFIIIRNQRQTGNARNVLETLQVKLNASNNNTAFDLPQPLSYGYTEFQYSRFNSI